jgi:predicted MFS family arabinose efflux permease
LAAGAIILALISLGLAATINLYVYLVIVFIYMLFFSVLMVYYNHLMLEFASDDKTSLDLATYTTLTNVFKPLGVLASGYLADSMGFSWAYYFAAALAFLSALTCLALPRPRSEQAEVIGAYATGS